MRSSDIKEKLLKVGYRITDEGHIADFKNTFIANMIINPKKQTPRKLNGKEEMYVLIGVSVDGKAEKEVYLSASELYKLQWIPSKIGAHAEIANGKEREFISIIKKLFKGTEIIEACDRTGWKRISDQFSYNDFTGAITGENSVVELDEHLSNYNLSREDRSITLAAKASLDLINVVNKNVFYTLMALVFLCPLLEFIKETAKLPEFVVWLYGFTGTRKTTIAKLFASHFGDFTNRVTASFNDTYASIELKAYKLKDSLMILDDFCPQQSFKETQNINTIAEKVVRAYGDRTSRGRLTVTMESQTQLIPGGMAIITGETIVPGNSTVARIVPLEVKKADVDLKELSKSQGESELLSIVMRKYIIWISKEVNSNKDDFLEAIKENYNYFLEEISVRAIDTHGRTYEAFSWLLVGLDMMYQFYLSNGIVSEEEVDVAMVEAKSEFLELIKTKHELSRTDNPMDLFLDTVKELITSRTITLKNLDTQDVIGNPYKPIDGFFDSEFYYFNANNIYGLVRGKLIKAGIFMQLPVRGLLKVLADNGVIKVEDTSNQPKKTIKNEDGTSSRPRMLHIRKEFLD